MKMLSPTKVAEILSVRQPKIREWLNKGILRGWKVGRIWRIREDDLEMFIQHQTNQKGKKIKEDCKLPEEDPFLQVIGSLSGDPISSEAIDKELYGN